LYSQTFSLAWKAILSKIGIKIEGVDLFDLILNYKLALENKQLMNRVRKMRMYRKVMQQRRQKITKG